MTMVPQRFLGFAFAALLLVEGPLLAGGILVFADGFEANNSCLWGTGTPTCPGPGFQIETPEILVGPGEETTYCYYFQAPNDSTLGVRRWALTLGSVAHDVTLYATYDASSLPADRQLPGTLSATDCGFLDSGATGTTANWIYAAHDPFAELILPADDGTGTPLAVEILAGQPMFLEMHFINPTGASIANTVRLDAEAHEVAVAYTKTASYYTYYNSLNIPPSSTGTTFSGTCAAPPGVKFWLLTTNTHKFASLVTLKDGAAPLLTTSDWEQPTIGTFPGPTFYTFSVSGLTYECTFDNPTGSTINSGNSRTTDENCVGIGYFFPATEPLLCIDNTGPL